MLVPPAQLTDEVRTDVERMIFAVCVAADPVTATASRSLSAPFDALRGMGDLVRIRSLNLMLL